VSGYIFQLLVDRRIKILLTAFGTHPGWHTVNVDRVAFVAESGTDDALFNLAVAEFANIVNCHCDHHQSSFA
jgi:hypothetical protein